VKPFSEACERNREPILEVLREAFATARRVLEIGSGTGQHAVFFAEALPHLLWQTADLPEAHAGILSWLEEAAMPNVLAPLELDVNRFDWQGARYDAVFSANTAHILSWPEVEQMFAGVGMALPEGGVKRILSVRSGRPLENEIPGVIPTAAVVGGPTSGSSFPILRLRH